jgi:hypothetical protein
MINCISSGFPPPDCAKAYLDIWRPGVFYQFGWQMEVKTFQPYAVASENDQHKPNSPSKPPDGTNHYAPKIRNIFQLVLPSPSQYH